MIQPNTIEGAPCVKAAPCAKLDRKKFALLAEICGSEFGVPGELILGKSKLQAVCFARYTLAKICSLLVTPQETADLFGWHYKSVWHALRTWQDLWDYKRGYREKAESAMAFAADIL